MLPEMNNTDHGICRGPFEALLEGLTSLRKQDCRPSFPIGEQAQSSQEEGL